MYLISKLTKHLNIKYHPFLENVIELGHRVLVPFGQRKVLGFVVGIHDEATVLNVKYKDVYDVLDLRPILTPEFIELSKYMVERYYSFYITCLKAMIPQALKVKYIKKAHILKEELIDDPMKSLFTNDYYLLKAKDTNIEALKRLEMKGAVEFIDEFSDKAKEKSIRMVHLLNNTTSLKNSKQQCIIDYLSEVGEDVAKSLLVDMGFSQSSINNLEKNGFIKIYQKEVYRNPNVAFFADKKVDLNLEQQSAYNSIKESFSRPKTFLLHGVCGSGKTEIYLKLIEDVVREGKEAIVLVPEISLTPQMTSRFKARFGLDVAVLHSRLRVGERYDEFRRILRGEAKIAVGARSAIFAPFKNLGLIVIDEEHEMSYIQDTNPKYDVVDIASFRSKYNNCPLVLGSATPRIIDYYKALNSEYTLLELLHRANGLPEPLSEIVDMREELKNKNKSVFSSSLKKALRETLQKKEQAILFINRRGYSSFVMCRECGSTIDCPNCNMSLVYHKYSNKLKCHHCGYEIPLPSKCPTCGSKYIKLLGDGTEKALEEMKKDYPGVRIERVDMDTMKEKDSYQKVFDDFRNQKIDVLIGTQIIAKGLDFPNVSLVGVLNADIGLKISEYNAPEVSYDLIEQVSGRAGRDKVMGRVIIQSYMPEHYAIRYAASHDYLGFYNEEIKNRRIMKNPPFTNYVELLITSADLKKAFIEANKIKTIILRQNYGAKIYGPNEDYIFKLNNIYRYKISMKYEEMDLFDTLEEILTMYQGNKDINISITRK